MAPLPTNADAAAATCAAAAVKGDKRDNAPFPWTLHRLLDESEDNQTTHIVSWLPSGKAFKVHQRDAFMSEVLPAYFRQTRYKSFVRQLNLWGFSCTSSGASKGSYSHEAFVRGQPSRCSEMRRTKIKGSSSIVASSSVACRTASSTACSPCSAGVSASRSTRVVSLSSSCVERDDYVSRASHPIPVFSCPELMRCDAFDLDCPSQAAPSQTAQDQSHRRYRHVVSMDESDVPIANAPSESADKVSRSSPDRCSVSSVSLGGLLDLAPQLEDWLESAFEPSSKAATEMRDAGKETRISHIDQFSFDDLPMEPFSQQNGSYHIDFDNIADLDFDLGFK